MADQKALAQRKKGKKRKKPRSYKGRALLWIFIFMVVDEITPGIPLAEALLLAILMFLPRWFLEMVHRVYEYMPHRQSWHTVGDICKRQVMTVAPDVPVIDVAQKMRDEHIRSLIVVESRPMEPSSESESQKNQSRKSKKAVTKADRQWIQVPIGIVTDRDLALRVEAQGRSWEDTLVSEVMTRNPVTAVETGDVHAVVEKMREIGTRQLPIVDQRGNLIGTLSLDDTVTMLSNSLDDMVELLQREIQREAEVG